MLQVAGVFAETEQWLWAAHRCLRKLREATDTTIQYGLQRLDEHRTRLNGNGGARGLATGSGSTRTAQRTARKRRAATKSN
jgi:hypothetical protein